MGSALDTDDEILQDFLLDAEEILENLNQQLVALETQSEDQELLNAIFRGFHTIKGGAGFLSLESMVNLCHKSEDVFNIVRQGKLIVDSTMMDTFLRVLDSLNSMFVEIKTGSYPTATDPAILDQLAAYLNEDIPTTAESETAYPAPLATANSSENNAMLDDEFEALLNQLHGNTLPGAAAPAPVQVNKPSAKNNDEITEEEFEALLDQLQDKSPTQNPPSAAPAPVPVNEPPAKNNDEITEEELEALLDQLQSKSPTQNPQPAPSIADKKPIENQALPAKQKLENTLSAQYTLTTEPVAATSKANKQADSSVRVDTSRLDKIINIVGELMLVRNQISTLEATSENEQMAKAVNNLAVITDDLQAAVMKTRMQPIKKVFGRFPRVVRDFARSLNKNINLELQGEDTELDKNLVEALADPLVHLIRNAVDHGIEMPDVRATAGKRRQGTITLSAAQEGDHILLTIADDGAGMNQQVLRSKAVEKGIINQETASRLTAAECFALIFAPGFSIKQEITDLSGRGVGMDVVKNSIAKLNGMIDISSEQGKGTTVSIRVPLTLAIIPTLMVLLGNQIFAFPLINVNEIFHLDVDKTNIVDGQQTIMIRNKALPLFYLRKWLTKRYDEQQGSEIKHVVIVNVDNQQVGFVVDQLIGQEEVVVKPLGALLHGTRGLSGAAITSDGRIALILDFPELMNAYAHRGY